MSNNCIQRLQHSTNLYNILETTIHKTTSQNVTTLHKTLQNSTQLYNQHFLTQLYDTLHSFTTFYKTLHNFTQLYTTCLKQNLTKTFTLQDSTQLHKLYKTIHNPIKRYKNITCLHNCTQL